MDSALDQAYAQFHAHSPWRADGTETGGPVVVELLEAFGARDQIEGTTHDYLGELPGPPGGAGEPLGERWSDALGDRERLSDWIATFEAEFGGGSFDEVLDRWVDRLAAGLFTGEFRPLTRVGHALRAYRRKETMVRRREVALALAVWASRFEQLPRTDRRSEGVLVSEVIDDLKAPRGDVEAGSVAEAAGDHPVVQETYSRVDPEGRVEAFGRDLMATAVRTYVDHTGDESALLGAILGMTAARYLAQFVSESTRVELLSQAAHALAAVRAMAAPDSIDEEKEPGTFDRIGLVRRALDDGSPEGLNLTDAVIQNYEWDGDRDYLLATDEFFGS